MGESGTSVTQMDESGTTHIRLYRNAFVDDRRGNLILSEAGIVFAPENSLGIEEIWQWDLIRTYLLSLDKRMLMIFLSREKKPLRIKPAEHYQTQLLYDEIRVCREEANSKLDASQDQQLISTGGAEERPSRIYTDFAPDAVSVLSDEAIPAPFERANTGNSSTGSSGRGKTDPPSSGKILEQKSEQEAAVKGAKAARVPYRGLAKEVAMPKSRPGVFEEAQKRRASARPNPKDPPMSGWVQTRPTEADIEAGGLGGGRKTEGQPRQEQQRQLEVTPAEGESSALFATCAAVVHDTGGDGATTRPGAVSITGKATGEQNRFRSISIILCIVVFALVGAVGGITAAFVKSSSGSSTSSSPFTCFKDRADLDKAVDAYLDLSDAEKGQFTAFPIDPHGPIEAWCFEGIQDFSNLFRKPQAAGFNADLSQWDVSEATDLSSMFATAEKFNGDISSWNLGHALDLNNMFRAALSFNVDLSSWQVGSVRNFAHMFCDSMYNIDLSSWDVSGATDLSHMFCRDVKWNQDISIWDVSACADMSSMFTGATAFNQNLCEWSPRFQKTPVVLDMFNDTLCPIATDPLFTNSPGPFCFACN